MIVPSSPENKDLPSASAKHPYRYTHFQEVDREALTPMMRHFVTVKEKHPNAVLLYRLGDFFECFFEDALVVAQELELTLTGKDAGKTIGRVPMAGIPHHALGRYCTQLVERGYAIAICDQVGDAASAQGQLVERKVTRLITPGTVVEGDMLEARRNHFLAAVVLAGHHWGLAYSDISTGDFWTTQAQNLDRLTQELMRLQPAEILVATDAPALDTMLRPGKRSQHLPDCLPDQFCYTLRSQRPFALGEARPRLLQKFDVRSLEGLGCDHLPLAVRAAGGVLEYLEDTQKDRHVPLQLLSTYTLTDFLTLDHQTQRNLELTQTVRDGTFHGSLLWSLDQTATAMGGRVLRRWLLQPLLDPDGIAARQETIQELVDDGRLREDLKGLLQQIYDVERLAGRAGSGTANARDLLALADSLDKLRDIVVLVTGAQSPYLQGLQTIPPELEHLAAHLRTHLVDDPPLHLTEGHLIRSGVNPHLDDLRHQVTLDQQWIANLETQERKRTGIQTLKVGYNKVFGYYLSIPQSKTDQAPQEYIRKQTLTNEERYITPDLKEREARILSAREELNHLEYEIFSQVRQEVGEEADSIRTVARAVAAVDVLCGLAGVAVYRDYCRPEVVPGREIVIQEGRHPVVEQSLPAGFFVPNATALGHEPTPETSSGARGAKTGHPDLVVLTGPNASGKSCYLRQVGLIQLLAQVGSFVPARSAQLGICDRIFTRVGAVDDLATGQSTFMVEMNETANILNHATPRSLVLLDEIGRGTATFDGLAIAWSVAEYLATTLRARTIFATHYHELNELASLLPNVANYQVLVQELADKIVFLHQVCAGGADRSYGIEAGRLAGLPPVVIQRARQVMQAIEQHSKIAVGIRQGSRSQTRQRPSSPPHIPTEQLDIFS